MQCPRCGFENIPGRENCAMCSISLTASGKTAVDVRPPRARDRSLWRRICYWGPIFPAYRRASRDIEHTGQWAVRSRIGWSLKTAGLLCLSVIPGFGEAYARRNLGRGVMVFVGSLGMLGLAALVYRTFACDLLIYGVVGLAMYSSYQVAEARRDAPRSASTDSLQRAAILLLVVAAYLGGYTLARYALSPIVVVGRINRGIPLAGVESRDSVLLWSGGELRRGDPVIATDSLRMFPPTPIGYHGPAAGRVLALPGDRIRFTNGAVYVNDLRLLDSTVVNLDPNPMAEYIETLSTGEYWIRPADLEGTYQGTAFRQPTGLVVSKERIYGRAVAVTWPPAHRRLIQRTH